jgi:hypothetical protein
LLLDGAAHHEAFGVGQVGSGLLAAGHGLARADKNLQIVTRAATGIASGAGE